MTKGVVSDVIVDLYAQEDNRFKKSARDTGDLLRIDTTRETDAIEPFILRPLLSLW